MRYAPLIRVSTEGQKEKGESLRTQKEQITQYVKSLGGEIPEICWQYSGQEHATPEYERQLLEKLLSDSAKDKFDAVIVADTSRWSRDNQKSKEGLNVLRSHGIKFFVGTMEYDLFNPEHSFILGMSAEIGEFQARQQSLKSIINRINRAKRNIPTSGKLPYGRTFDPEKGWGLDPEKVKIIQTAAKRYLEGMPIPEVGKLAGMNFTNLWKILNHRSGTEWQCRFRNERLNVDETVTLKIPRLLDDETIQAIKEKGAANKTYTHGEIKHRYLLSRMIFCKACNYTLVGQTNKNGNQYYRHPRHRKYECELKNWVSAPKIENAVLEAIFEMFGDQERIEQAIRRATPDLNKVQAMLDEVEDLKKQKQDIIKQRNNLVDMAADGTLSKDEIKLRITPIRESLKAIDERLEYLELQLKDQPSPADINKKSKLARGVIVDALKRPGAKTVQKLMDGPWEKKRKILERAFAGKDRQGNRLGVYVIQTGDKDRPFKFEIRAVLEQIIELIEEKGVEGSFVRY
ncbi:recombinase family protein [Desulfonatronovibrio hydrogenovorans]|uniref:recombinase family protein n=1 Tax=Desulfonatronovibrio hydrogenovorans TaxID=53245 RepID=UPI00048B41BA|nr:recombinase family protein [Desulfonatronovibrio hydrogenovorans]